MSDEQPVYLGNGKLRTEPFWVMKLSLTAEDVQKLQDNLDNGWVNIDVKERREPSAKGFTHYCQINSWKPEGGQSGAGTPAPKAAPAKKPNAVPEPVDVEDIEEISAEDLPF